jgi:2-polyprenyl-3-methyl-5-hydroxy-6-metoxy-1,4-benzoquinol methylase
MTGTGFYKRKLQTGHLQRDRDSLLLRLCEGKRVLHVGCTDFPLTSQRLAEGRILHKKLLDVTQLLIGVDTDQHGLKHMEEAYGGQYFCHDLSFDTAPPAGLMACTPDIILAADVIEHVAAPGPFLRGLALLAEGTTIDTRVIVSTPNGLGARSVMYTAFGIEMNHPNHRLVCTPRTLTVLADDANLIPVEWYFYNIKSGEGVAFQLVDHLIDTLAWFRMAYADGMTAVFKSRSKMSRA